MGVKIQWDPKKAAANKRKHGVSFREAATCFDDPDGCYLRNEAPSYEDRLILIGLSAKSRLLFVVHAEVGRDEIRIVSARRASPAQRRIYDGLD
ncbi:MAG: BrnT family toxin [Polyangiaceae bacterium]|nr:BrnT family toxin [Polyangiaceae bacterium]